MVYTRSIDNLGEPGMTLDIDGKHHKDPGVESTVPFYQRCANELSSGTYRCLSKPAKHAGSCSP